MSFTFTNIDSREAWNQSVQSFPHYSFLHSWEWGEFNKQLGDTVYRLGMQKKGELIGVALLLKVGARRGSFLFCPHGPLMDWNDRELAGAFIQYILDFARKKGAWFIRFSPLIPSKNSDQRKVLGRLGFRPSPIHMHAEETWMLDITPPENDLLMDARKGTRNLIRRAEREGVKIIQSSSVDDLEAFNKLYKETAARQDFVPYSMRYLKKEFETFAEQDKARWFFADYQGEVISGAMILYYGKTAFYHHGASSMKHRKIPGNHGLQWASILEAKRRGYKTYNFWGIAPEDSPEHPWKGLTFFKQGFGGYRIDFMHAQDYIISPLYWITYTVETMRRIRRGF